MRLKRQININQENYKISCLNISKTNFNKNMNLLNLKKDNLYNFLCLKMCGGYLFVFLNMKIYVYSKILNI